MLPFIALLQKDPRWQHVLPIIDMKVYGRKQLFRVPGASKLAPFDEPSATFDLDSEQNVLLPVNSVTGVCEIPFTQPGRPEPYLSLRLWLAHLVCTPVSYSQTMKALEGVLFHFFCHYTALYTCQLFV